MASSTTDHHLAVHDDEEVGVNLLRCDAPRTSHAYRTRWIVDGRTQWIVLSATINNPTCAACVGGTGSIVLVTAGVGEQNSAADGWKLVLHSEPCGSVCAVAFTAIEADLEAFSPGRAAAVGVHGRLAEGERAF